MREAQSKHNADKLGNKRFAQNYTQIRASLVAQKVKNPPAVQKTWVQSLGWKDPLEKGMATHPSILAWRIPWTETGGLQSMRLERAGHDWAINTFNFNSNNHL